MIIIKLGVKLVSHIFQAKMEGDKLKSTELFFNPSENYTNLNKLLAEIKTAGMNFFTNPKLINQRIKKREYHFIE